MKQKPRSVRPQVRVRPGKGQTRRNMVPQRFFLTRGVGVHRERLTSFEMALRDAGIAHFNLVAVSSILPPGCRIVTREEGIDAISPGEIVFVVLARNASNEPHRVITAATGVSIPADPNMYGYLSEHHAFGQTEQEAGDYAEDLAASMLATTLGVPFDADRDYNERREQYKVGGHIVDSTSIAISAVGDEQGRWTTVLAAAVLLCCDGNAGEDEWSV